MFFLFFFFVLLFPSSAIYFADLEIPLIRGEERPVIS
jgi:hypothetical protein